MHDEELAAGGIGRHCARHRQDAASMLEIVGNAVHLELALYRISGAAYANALRIAALDHEAANYSVENNAVIKLILYQRDEVVDRIGCDLGIKLGLYDIAVFHFDCYYRIAHQCLSFKVLSMSRAASRFASSFRLSYNFLPLHRPSSTFTLLSLK